MALQDHLKKAESATVFNIYAAKVLRLLRRALTYENYFLLGGNWSFDKIFFIQIGDILCRP